jgi:hypothetical protein
MCDLQWQQIELSEGRLHVGTPSVHRIRRDTRCGRFVSYDAITLQMLTYSFPSAVLSHVQRQPCRFSVNLPPRYRD